MLVDAILLAAGEGRRFDASSKTPLPKQFQNIHGISLVVHSLLALERLDCIRNYVVVVPERYLVLARQEVERLPESIGARIKIVSGGAERHHSSWEGLRAIENPPERVLIHDACRPYLSPSFCLSLKQAIQDRSFAAWIPVVRGVDTLKRVVNRTVVETVGRDEIFRAQTPQIFEFSLIRGLMERAQNDQTPRFTDDASILETYGIPVGIFDGDLQNIKLTHGFEKKFFEFLLPHGTTPSAMQGKCASDSDLISTA